MKGLGLAPLVVGLLALVAVACTAPKSEVCRRVCGRESECVESRSSDEASFDEAECVAACAALERDPSTRGIVTAHDQCVAAATSCAEIRATCK
jgi:hypothetical protein